MLLIDEIPEFPKVNFGDNLSELLVKTIRDKQFELNDNDVLCIASKVVSIAEKRAVCLNDIVPGETAIKIHERIKRKDPRVLQLIIEATGDETGGRLYIDGNFIAGWLPNGLCLTSAGIDKMDSNNVILLPENPDKSAAIISEALYKNFGVKVGIVITDSDGRIDKSGSTQIAIGVYGVPALRKTFTPDNETGKERKTVETLCDMIAAAAALIMGQRGTNKPVVRIKGLKFDFDEEASIVAALTQNKKGT